MLTQAANEPPETLSIESLDARITALNARMTAQEFELLMLIREFDERGGWLKWGSTSCADWLHWRCDLSMSAAREKVRVAHAVHVLPAISSAFERGALSYSKVRALTRVATAGNEASLLEFALEVSAALVEQHCQQLRNVHQDPNHSAKQAHDRRSLTAFRRCDANMMTLTVEIPIEDGELVLSALDKVLAADDSSADASCSYRARQADALIELCKAALSGGSLRGGIDAESSTADQYQVVVHVDESALTEQPAEDARADLPVETVRRLSCDGSLVSVSSDANGAILNVGRRRRTVPIALKRAVHARDRHCQYPGCTRSRFVDTHHIQHWAHGGETSLDNLMLLCSHHHRLVHEGGFQIVLDRNGQRCFRRADGRAVPLSGYRSCDQEDDPSAEGFSGVSEPPPLAYLLTPALTARSWMNPPADR